MDGVHSNEEDPLGCDEVRRSGVDAVLDVLLAERGLDFRRYRRSTIERRLSHRLVAVQARDWAAYLAVLAGEPAEIDRLIGQLTLKVTGFFRNPTVFSLIEQRVLPELLTRSRLLVWSAGCATGEEAYSIGLLLEGALRDEARRPAVTIIATDIDSRALAAARAGRYPSAAVADLPPHHLARWFSITPAPAGHYYTVDDQLRHQIRFEAHNLVEHQVPPPWLDAPGCDIILCRNVLIYFERSLQEQVLGLLHRSLRPGGFLVLGEAESLPLRMEPQYQCLDRRARVYQRLACPPPVSQARLTYGETSQ